MNIKKIILSLSYSLILTNLAISFTSSAMTENKYPNEVTQTKLPITKNNFNSTLTASLKPGSVICKVYHPKQQTCLPVVNVDNDHLFVRFLSKPNEMTGSINKMGMSALIAESIIHNSVSTIVTNTITKKVIFQGDIFNKIGIACNKDHCIKWDKVVNVAN
ncbi:MAG: hypothetical protein HAW66_02125 [Shewanella sp.]|nr:hypothetical protein [Shewanella sp.]